MAITNEDIAVTIGKLEATRMVLELDGETSMAAAVTDGAATLRRLLAERLGQQ